MSTRSTALFPIRQWVSSKRFHFIGFQVWNNQFENYDVTLGGYKTNGKYNDHMIFKHYTMAASEEFAARNNMGVMKCLVALIFVLSLAVERAVARPGTAFQPHLTICFQPYLTICSVIRMQVLYSWTTV